MHIRSALGYLSDGQLRSRPRSMSGKPGGLNGSTQHSSRTRLALKTEIKSLARVRSAGTLPWLGHERGQPNRSLLSGESPVDSTHWMVLRRPSELARQISHLSHGGFAAEMRANCPLKVNTANERHTGTYRWRVSDPCRLLVPGSRN
jgi:hypothetical protein